VGGGGGPRRGTEVRRPQIRGGWEMYPRVGADVAHAAATADVRFFGRGKAVGGGHVAFVVGGRESPKLLLPKPA